MNHLAHFYLSFNDEGLILGNWSGDVVKGNDWQDYPRDIQRGILLHRAIDTFTDAHPATHVFADQLRPFAGRYARPVTDVARDHLLSLCWEDFSDEPLPDFASRIYKILENRLLDLPEPLRERTPRMITANWLCGYGTPEGLNFVLEKFEKRLHPHPLDRRGLLDFLKKEKTTLLADFRDFFPDLVEYARRSAGI